MSIVERLGKIEAEVDADSEEIDELDLPSSKNNRRASIMGKSTDESLFGNSQKSSWLKAISKRQLAIQRPKKAKRVPIAVMNVDRKEEKKVITLEQFLGKATPGTSHPHVIVFETPLKILRTPLFVCNSGSSKVEASKENPFC